MGRIVQSLTASTPPVVTITLGTVADQPTLNPITFPAPTATVDGAPATITAWSWLVDGATTGITDETVEQAVYAPTAAGTRTRTLTATIDGVEYQSGGDTFEVGVGGWVTLADVDTSALVLADWRSGGPYTLGGAAITINAPAAVDVLGPDGSAGIQFSQTGEAYFSGTVRNGAAVSILIADMFPGGVVPANAEIAVMSAWDSAQALGTTFIYHGQAIEPAALNGQDQLAARGGDRFDGRHVAVMDVDGAAETWINISGLAGRPRGYLQILDFDRRTNSNYYTLTARTAGPDMSDLAGDGWVIYDFDGGKGHLHAQAGVYDPDTYRHTLYQGGAIAWDCVCTRLTVRARW